MAGSGKAHLRERDGALLRVEDLTVEFPAPRRRSVHAVSGISFDVARGETLGIVGESGCGKSTTGRAILQLPPPTSGRIVFDGHELTGLGAEEMRRYRAKLQMIFQDPRSSLNPRRTILDLMLEPLRAWSTEPRDAQVERIRALLEAVGIDAPHALPRKPHEFSGGQCQRIAIARALILDPSLVICDEPVSSLDVSIQAQILNILKDMKERFGLTLLFIAHDLAVVNNISDRVVVMYLGKVCEVAGSGALFTDPAHPYSALLVSSSPSPDPDAPIGDCSTDDAELPSPVAPPSGCRFRTRCPRATTRCAQEEPTLRAVGEGHFVACHHPLVEVETVREAERVRAG